jgi:hypothetical protein
LMFSQGFTYNVTHKLGCTLNVNIGYQLLNRNGKLLIEQLDNNYELGTSTIVKSELAYSKFNNFKYTLFPTFQINYRF